MFCLKDKPDIWQEVSQHCLRQISQIQCIKVVLKTEDAFLCGFWLLHSIGQRKDFQYLNYMIII